MKSIRQLNFKHRKDHIKGFTLVEVLIVAIIVLGFGIVLARVSETLKIMRDFRHQVAIRVELTKQLSKLRDTCSDASTPIPYKRTAVVIIDGERVQFELKCEALAANLVKAEVEASTSLGNLVDYDIILKGK